MNESYHILFNGLHQHEHKNLWPEALHFRPAHSSEYFFNLMDCILINPVVSSELKLSNESYGNNTIFAQTLGSCVHQ
jgi:hypothetical protein